MPEERGHMLDERSYIVWEISQEVVTSVLSKNISDYITFSKKNTLYVNQQGTNCIHHISQRHLFTNNNLFDQNFLDR